MGGVGEGKSFFKFCNPIRFTFPGVKGENEEKCVILCTLLEFKEENGNMAKVV